jgi:hypothetical protein
MVRDTPPYGHAPTYQISLTYLKRQKCYDPGFSISFRSANKYGRQGQFLFLIGYCLKKSEVNDIWYVGA